MGNFFEKKVVKCVKCKLQKDHNKKKVDIAFKRIGDIKGDKNSPVLIILSEAQSDVYINHLKNILFKVGLHDYAMICAVECMVKDGLAKARSPEVIFHCNSVNLDLFPNVKAIVTVGSALYSITKNKDLVAWFEFQEYMFNQTYFYTGFESKKHIRVYPIPHTDEIVKNDFDNYEVVFAKRQFKKIKDFLNEK